MGNKCIDLCGNTAAIDSPDRKSEQNAKNSDNFTEAVAKIEPKDEQSPSPATNSMYQLDMVQILDHIDQETLQRALESHLIFKDMNFKSQKKFIKQMHIFEFDSNEIIVRQGDTGDYFYIILDGSVDVIVDQTKVNVLKKGQSFGDLALIEGIARNATIKTLEKCTFLGIDGNDFRDLLKETSEFTYNLHRQLVLGVPLFKNLDEEQIEKIISIIEEEEHPPDTLIIKEKEFGDRLYIIKNGAVACHIKNKKIKELGQGGYFGELSFLENTCRKATIVSVEKVSLLSIQKSAISSILGDDIQQVILENCFKFSIELSKLLNFLTAQQINKVRSVAEIVRFSKGQVVIPEKSLKSQTLYIVLKGSLTCNNKKVRQLNCIGEVHILKPSEKTYKSPFTAFEDSVIALCDRTALERTLKYILQDLRLRNWLIGILKKIPIFKLLSESILEDMANSIDVCNFAKGTTIFEKWEAADCVYIVKKGSISIMKENKVLRVVEKNNFFGERSIILDEMRSATAIANKNSVCWILYREKFLNIVDETTRKQMLKRINLQDDYISLEDLKPVKQLGQGSFGTVVLTFHSSHEFLYAVKYIDLKVTEQRGAMESIQNEESILLKLDHPLIIKLTKTIKDRERIYFIMEYVRGCDLFDVLEEPCALKNEDSKFYTACLILALEYLHKKNIIFRDLKPENVLIDNEGYPKLVDFGCAKVIKGRTFTIAGTPTHFAPEVILGKGYSFSCDLWSLGIMLYELLYGKIPFGENELGIKNVYRGILMNKLKFPNNSSVHPEAKELVRKLLTKDPAKRIDIVQAKQGVWFKGLKWNDLIVRKIKAPFCPTVKSITTYINLAQRNPETLLQYIRRHDTIQITHKL